MAIDLSTTNAFPHVHRAALAGGSSSLNRVDLPPGSEVVSFRFATNAGTFTFTGADGDPLGTHYGTVAADTWVTIQMHGRSTGQARTEILLAAAVAGTTVEILVEEIG
jgi:hypothetical protein